jgi:hypothetical protein
LKEVQEEAQAAGLLYSFDFAIIVPPLFALVFCFYSIACLAVGTAMEGVFLIL